MGFSVIIPARYASSRLPGKPLIELCGKPLIQHVYQRVIQCDARQVIIATDDTRIEGIAKKFGADVCMTSHSHRSGTERIKEVADKRGFTDDEIIVNVQGDEPLMSFENVNQVAAMLQKQVKIPVATLCAGITNVADIFDPNVVKVIRDKNNVALYFSRAPIPWDRKNFPIDGEEISGQLTELRYSYLKHIGIYAYRTSFINDYLTWSQTGLEAVEMLEQLRILEQGSRILVDVAHNDPGIGIDTEADLERVRAILAAS
ncbi:MAG: 3-deoxy-manno-octulosonate cytidylyltransferase [Thiohalomonadales bacterium]